MNDDIIKIIDLADRATNKGQHDLARKLDIYAQYLMQIRVAQHAISQGYAERNNKCWLNCYRIKKANNSNISANDAWQSCYVEYKNSINSDGSAWDHYAATNNTIKISSKDSNIVDYHRKFARSIGDKIASGATIAFAVNDSLHDMDAFLAKEVLLIGKNLGKLATRTDDAYAKDIQDISDTLQKHSQGILSGLGKMIGNVGRSIVNLPANLATMFGQKPELLRGTGYNVYENDTIIKSPKCTDIKLQEFVAQENPKTRDEQLASINTRIKEFLNNVNAQIESIKTAEGGLSEDLKRLSVDIQKTLTDTDKYYNSVRRFVISPTLATDKNAQDNLKKYLMFYCTLYNRIKKRTRNLPTILPRLA